MAGPNITKLFERKQAFIKEISGEKNLGIQFSNALNNAVAVWSVLAAHPELDVDKAAKDLMEWVKFFLTLKDETKPEVPEGPKVGMAAEQAVQETERVFDRLPMEGPMPGPQSMCTEPQTKKIWVELHRLGYKDENHLATIEMVLGISSLKSIKDLTRKQASAVIEKLIRSL